MTVTKTYSDDLDIVADLVTINGNSMKYAPRAHDSSYSPLVLWQLNGTLNDSIGTNHLSLATGTSLYSYCNGLNGFFFNGSTRLISANALLLTGDMSVEFLAYITGISGSVYQTLVIEAEDVNLDQEERNILWNARVTANNGALEYFSEYGAGTNTQYTTTASPIPGILSHIALVRESNIVKFYLNGLLVATSSAINTPTTTGSPLQKVHVGGTLSFSSFLSGFMSSIKIINSALSPAQVLREANYTLHGGA